MSEEYTLEKTIAFFSIGREHYVDQDLARYVASELTRMSAEIQQKEAKRRALWDALVSAYKREGCGLGEAQILADVVMDSASDKQATDPKRDPLGEFDRRERSGSSVSDRRDDSWWCDSCQETHHDGQTCSAATKQCICGDEHLRNGWVKEHCPVHGSAEPRQ